MDGTPVSRLMNRARSGPGQARLEAMRTRQVAATVAVVPEVQAVVSAQAEAIAAVRQDLDSLLL